MESLNDEDLLDLQHLHKQIRSHASGLELLSIPPRLIKDHLLDDIPPLLNLLKDHYDFILVLAPLEENAISPIVLPEVEKVMLISWDQAPELTGPRLQRLSAKSRRRIR